MQHEMEFEVVPVHIPIRLCKQGKFLGLEEAGVVGKDRFMEQNWAYLCF